MTVTLGVGAAVLGAFFLALFVLGWYVAITYSNRYDKQRLELSWLKRTYKRHKGMAFGYPGHDMLAFDIVTINGGKRWHVVVRPQGTMAGDNTAEVIGPDVEEIYPGLIDLLKTAELAELLRKDEHGQFGWTDQMNLIHQMGFRLEYRHLKKPEGDAHP